MQNIEGKRELQEHLGTLVHSHNSVLAKKNAESEALEIKLRDHAIKIEVTHTTVKTNELHVMFLFSSSSVAIRKWQR